MTRIYTIDVNLKAPITAQASLPGMAPPLEYGDNYDFYATPKDAVDAVLPWIPRLSTTDWNILEPAAGTGSLLRWLLPSVRPTCNVLAVEIHKARYNELGDFLHSPGHIKGLTQTWNVDFLRSESVPYSLAQFETQPLERPWLIPFNPPYSEPYEGIGLDFVERCLEIAWRRPGSVVAALLPSDFCTGVDRTERIHTKYKSGFLPLRTRPYFGGEHGSGKRPFAWFVFDTLRPPDLCGFYSVIG